jgi:hypothetical protein
MDLGAIRGEEESVARRLLLVPVVVIGLLSSAPPAMAETTAKVDGNVIRITIVVDVVDAKGKTGPDGTPLVTYWETVLNNTWGAAFNQLPYKNCFKLELKVTLNERGAGFDATTGNHRIIVGAASGGGFEGTGFDGAPETSRNAKTGDGTRSFEHDRDGAIPVDAPPTVVAHEFGHLMGLGDDRANRAPKDGRDGTMMVGGVPGVDPNVVQKIDKNLIDRLGEAVGKHLDNQGKKLPNCQTWKGTLRSEHSIPIVPCTFTWSGTFDFGVVEDQVIGTATVSPDGRCPAYAGPVTITGDADETGFTLASNSYLLAAGTRMSKTAPDRAKGTSEFHDSYNDVVTTFKMECRKNCGDTADVG